MTPPILHACDRTVGGFVARIVFTATSRFCSNWRLDLHFSMPDTEV